MMAEKTGGYRNSWEHTPWPQGGESEHLRWWESFITSKSPQVSHLLQKSHTSQSFPSSFSIWRTSLWGAFLFKAPHQLIQSLYTLPSYAPHLCHKGIPLWSLTASPSKGLFSMECLLPCTLFSVSTIFVLIQMPPCKDALTQAESVPPPHSH